MFTCLCFTLLASGAVFSQVKNSGYSWDNLPRIVVPSFKPDTFNIVSFGAKPDYLTINTKSINAAITACSDHGGGVVLIPAGMWMTGPVVLKNNVNLFVSRGALLQFTADKSQYELIEGNFEGRKAIRNQSPISGTDLTNIAITGTGIIDGHGEVWRAMSKDYTTENEWKALVSSGGLLNNEGTTWYPSKSYADGLKLKNAGKIEPGKPLEDYAPIKDFFRPNLLVLVNCKKVLLQNATFENSPAWCLHTLQCEDLTFDGVHVKNAWNAQNGDAMDIESCSNVKVTNCTIDAGDDGICIKSGKDEEGRKVGKATRNMVITNNTVYSAHGGFVIGSEMSGGVHDIFVSDCTFIGTDNGLRFKTVRGRGGIVENIFIRNIVMRNIQHDAILFDMYYFANAPTLAQTNGIEEKPPVNEGTPQFRNFYISNLTCEGAERAMLIRGLPEMSIANIHLENVTIKAGQGADIIDADKIDLKNVTLECKNVTTLVNIENSSNIHFDGLKAIGEPKFLMDINGPAASNISLRGVDFKAPGQLAQFNYGAAASALTILK